MGLAADLSAQGPEGLLKLFVISPQRGYSFFLHQCLGSWETTLVCWSRAELISTCFIISASHASLAVMDCAAETGKLELSVCAIPIIQCTHGCRQ